MMDNKGKKIIIVKGPLKPIRLFAEKIGDGFRRIGYEVLFVDDTDAVNMHKLIAFANSKIHACFGFNNAPEILMSSEFCKEYITQLNIPVINMLVDNPIYFMSELLTKKNDVVITIDMDHMNYVMNNYPNIPTVGFMAHGGTINNNFYDLKPFDKRNIDVLYAGSIHVYNGEVEIENIEPFHPYSFDYNHFRKKLYEKMIYDTDKCLIDAIDTVLLENNINIDYQEKQILYLNMVAMERLVSSIYRERLIRELAVGGLNLTLCGEKWEHYEDIINLPNVNYLGLVSPEEVLELICDSKIVINHMTWFKNGSHERIFNGMLGGALVISDLNKYIKDNFIYSRIENYEDINFLQEEIQLFTYNLGNEDKIAPVIRKIISSTEELDKIKGVVKNGYIEAALKHTWYHRALEIDKDIIDMWNFR